MNKDDLPKEDSPFKVYDFIELAQNHNWEESHVFQEICDKRYMFVVFKEEAPGEYVLNQVKFWGFPERLIDEAQRVWNETRAIINDGVQLTQSDKGVSTNFPQSQVINSYLQNSCVKLLLRD